MFTATDKNSRSRKLKHNIIETVNELIQDINTCHEQIAEQAVEHIHQKYLPLLVINKIYLMFTMFLTGDTILHVILDILVSFSFQPLSVFIPATIIVYIPTIWHRYPFLLLPFLYKILNISWIFVI